MNEDNLIYELTEEDRRALSEGVSDEATPEDKAKFAALREDVARLGGYLKGRADSDRPKLGVGDGAARGPGSNGDLA